MILLSSAPPSLTILSASFRMAMFDAFSKKRMSLRRAAAVSPLDAERAGRLFIGAVGARTGEAARLFDGEPRRCCCFGRTTEDGLTRPTFIASFSSAESMLIWTTSDGSDECCCCSAAVGFSIDRLTDDFAVVAVVVGWQSDGFAVVVVVAVPLAGGCAAEVEGVAGRLSTGCLSVVSIRSSDVAGALEVVVESSVFVVVAVVLFIVLDPTGMGGKLVMMREEEVGRHARR